VHYLVAVRAYALDAPGVEIDGPLPFAPFIAAQHVLFAPRAHTANLPSLAAAFFMLRTFQGSSDQSRHDRLYEKPHGRGIHWHIYSRVCIGTALPCLANGMANNRDRDIGWCNCLPAAGNRGIAVSLREALGLVCPEGCDYFVIQCPVLGKVTHLSVHFLGPCELEAEHEKRGRATQKQRLSGRWGEAAAGQLGDALRIGAQVEVRA
jgi:hypothetical protein